MIFEIWIDDLTIQIWIAMAVTNREMMTERSGNLRSTCSHTSPTRLTLPSLILYTCAGLANQRKKQKTYLIKRHTEFRFSRVDWHTQRKQTVVPTQKKVEPRAKKQSYT